jgi:hypothetical protein
MPVNEAFLFDAAWLFLAGWSAVVLALSVIAFRGDLGLHLGARPPMETVVSPARHGPRPDNRPKA